MRAFTFLFAIVMAACPLAAQEEPDASPGTRNVKGELIQWKIQGLAGEMALRSADDVVERCRVLAASRIIRSGIRIHPHGVRLGDTVEVVGDYRGGPGRCTVRQLFIRQYEGERRLVNGKYRFNLYPRAYLDGLWARGLLTFSGVVAGMEDGRLVLRLRERKQRSFALREDTLFQSEGRLVDRDALESFTPVFIRASRTADGDLEAYQVMWGQILRPGR